MIRRDGMNVGNLSGKLRRIDFKVVLLLTLLAIIGLSMVGDYGITADEKLEVQFVFWNLRLRQSGVPIPKMSEYYGSIFPFASEAIYQIKSLLQTGKLDLFFEVGETADSISNEDFLKRIKVKHAFTFLFSLMTYLAVAGIVGILAGREWAWLGVIVLAGLPRYWGHSFFNPKDIPYATMFTVGTLAGVRLVGRYLNAERGEIKLGLNHLTAHSLLFGVLVGLVTGTRIAGCFLLAFVGLAHLVSALGKGTGLRIYLRFWGMYALMGVAWLGTVFVLHPASWSNPFRWLYDGFLYLSSYEYWEGVNLFNGFLLSGKDVPWYYLPVWIGITTPALILLLMGVGAVLLLIRYRRLTPEQQACAWLVLLQMGFLPGIAVLRDSVVYNGLRQFMFILPGIAILATVALIWLVERVKRASYRWAFLACLGLLALPTVVEMVNLHPYEYVFFNRAVGGLREAGKRFDTEYWGLSMKEGMEWINANTEPGTTVVTSRHYVSSEPYADPKNTIVRVHNYDKEKISRPFYTLVLGSYEYILGSEFADCPVVYQVLRQGIPLTIVRKCD